MIQHGPTQRHVMAIRSLTVKASSRIGASLARITLTGDDLNGFTSTGPADHVKVFFPDPVTGELAVPTLTAEGLRGPEAGTVFARDFTPRSFRPADGETPAELDLDFVLHSKTSPASAWAVQAAIGDTLLVAGPRGSRPVPSGVSRVILGADETALPAVARWIEMLPSEVKVCAFVELENDSDAVYFDPDVVHRAHVIWLEKGSSALERAIRGLGELDDSTYVWIAGESESLVPVRRYLRRELGLSAAQVKVDGYWRRGEAGRDHHAPIDPSDPEN